MFVFILKSYIEKNKTLVFGDSMDKKIFSEEEIRPSQLFNQYLSLANEDILNFFQKKNEFVEINCPACDSNDKQHCFFKQGFKYQSCSNCESLFLSPRPTEEMINLFYKNGASVKFWSTHFFKETAEARRKNLIIPKSENILENAKKYLINKENLSYCDIGSGYGLLLEEISKKNYFKKIIGIEPSPSLANDGRIKGFEIIEKNLEEMNDNEILVDYATCFEVLEHLFDPYSFLISAKKILKGNSIFQFTTLTCSGFDLQVLWENSKSIYPPHHINLLSIQGLKILIERAGLKIINYSTPGNLDIDIVKNAYANYNPLDTNKFINQICKSDIETRNKFQIFLKENNLSSHISFIVSTS